ncbi:MULTISPECIES: LysR family transcriptional regulator [unclassified Phenylobacterium]|uniref:LysR family transcriptional regulator n=1 Tax=unclassified Phenylobacterium TaxID=2640670 RepID=UPI00083A49A4|nr:MULTISPECIES: LysR family transcriptional regulator [unclassified Phenylobacterium]
MELRELRYFLAVYETGSVTAAARRCFISQPSISTALAALERELETVLFVRHRKGVAATAAAEALYARARRLVDDALALKSLFAAPPAARIVVGLMSSLDISRTLGVLKPLSDDPTVRLSLVGADEPCDARIIARSMASEEEAFAPLWSEAYVVALPPRHKLRFKPTLSLEDLKGLPLIARCNCENAAGAADLGFKPEIAAVATTEEWAIALVEAGIGATVLPEGVVPASTPAIVRPISDLRLRREVGVAYRRAEVGAPATTRILDAVADRTARAA